jgi:hypothetical protein
VKIFVLQSFFSNYIDTRQQNKVSRGTHTRGPHTGGLLLKGPHSRGPLTRRPHSRGPHTR